jgi:integrase
LRAELDRPSSSPGTLPDSIGAWVDKWLAMERSRLATGKLGDCSANMARVHIHHFRDWIDAETPVSAVNESKLEGFYTFLAEQMHKAVWGAAHCHKILAVAKRFIRYCWEHRLIELPRNLDAKRLTFTVPAQEVEVWTADELRRYKAVVSGQSRLHFLLMLNCGMLGQDINDLQDREVDWKAGIIMRKRSKTDSKENVPVVRYKLWDETFELLKKWRSGGTTVLLTKSGKPWIVSKLLEKYHRSDSIANALRYWMPKAGVKCAPKELRATSASKLGEHPSYKFYTQYFLGHSPRSIAEKHYAKPTDGEFFKALEWLEGAL